MSEHPTNQYALDVVREIEVAGPLVRGACRRHLDDLDHGHLRGLRFDEDKADHAMNFFPTVLRLNGGEFEGVPFVLHPPQEFIVGSLFGWIREDDYRRFRVAYIEMGKGSGKAAAIDTPVMTPYGWKTMGSLDVGDMVFDERGDPCEVLATSEVMHDRPCYRVTFSDGESIVADAQHLWRTSALRTGYPKKGKKHDPSLPKKNEYAIRTTEHIANTIKPWNYADKPDSVQAKWNHRVDVAAPLKLLDVENLPIAPYTLGAWLGDGSADEGIITGIDDEIFDRVVVDGYQITHIYCKKNTRVLKVRFASLRKALKDNKIIGNKRIPRVYFTAGTEQRRLLLAGVLDTDGSVDKEGHCELTLCKKDLCEDVLELMRGLGFKVVINESDAKLNGVVVGRRWRISFKAYKDFPPFLLKRKVARLRDKPSTRALSLGRMIVGCEVVDSVPVRCISVSSSSKLFLIGKTLIPTHNSPLAAGIGLYGLVGDREPRAQIYAGAAKREQAMILFRDAVAMVQQSPALKNRFKLSGRDDKVWNIFDPVTNGYFRTISADKAASGTRPHIGLIDELHEHKNASVMNMMTAGRKGGRQPLIIAITNSGFDKTSVCWEYHNKSTKICTYGGDEEVAIDDAFFSFVCGLDLNEDPFLDERCWKKANPLLGVTITEEYLREEVTAGRSMPSKESLVRRLNFCEWTQAESPLISGASWAAAGGPGPDEVSTFNLSIFKGAEVILGLDLSAVSDLTAAVFVVRKDGIYYWWPEFWIPVDRIKERVDKDKIPYDIWLRKKFIRTTPGKTISLDHVARDLKKIIKENDLNVIEVAYDRWRIEDFKAACVREDLELNMVEFGQGFKDMGPAVDSIEKALADEKVRHNKSPTLRMCAANAVVISDPTGARKFDKGKDRTKRIDGIVAAGMAHHRASLLPEAPPTYTIRWAD